MSSTIKPNGKKIQRLRSERGWTVDDLARKAGCVPKSIYNAEQGKNIRRPTLAEIAAALKVEPKDLILADQPEQPANLMRLQVVIEADMEKLNHLGQLKDLVFLLKTMLSPAGEIAIKDVKPGSVLVTLEMRKEDALRLLALFPDFEKHARKAIRTIPDTHYAERLLSLMAAIRQLRIAAEPVSDSSQRRSGFKIPHRSKDYNIKDMKNIEDIKHTKHTKHISGKGVQPKGIKPVPTDEPQQGPKKS